MSSIGASLAVASVGFADADADADVDLRGVGGIHVILRSLGQ